MPHTLFLLSPLARRGGNYCTINRISDHLSSEGYECHLEDPQEFSSKHEFRTVVDRNNIKVLIGIHALRTGTFMKESGMPYILILGGTDMNVFCNDPKSMEAMTQAVYGARFVVCFSPSNEARALTLWPDIQPCQLKVISQAVHTNPSSFCLQSYLSSYLPHDTSNEAEKPIIFVCVGGIRPVKNPLYLLSVFKEWHARDKRIIYLILGPKLDEKYTTTIFEPAVLGQPGIVYIPGLLANDAHAVISQCFALVNTSDSEGMCLAILEAMQLEIPVLARDIPGNRAIVEDGHTGFLFDSPQTFYQKAQLLLQDKETQNRLTENAKDYVDVYHNLNQERQLYTDLIKQCIEDIKTTDLQQ